MSLLESSCCYGLSFCSACPPFLHLCLSFRLIGKCSMSCFPLMHCFPSKAHQSSVSICCSIVSFLNSISSSFLLVSFEGSIFSLFSIEFLLDLMTLLKTELLLNQNLEGKNIDFWNYPHFRYNFSYFLS